jgi:CelD/BcsL family acetyltransferase involved in cellulose biosynthesis
MALSNPVAAGLSSSGISVVDPRQVPDWDARVQALPGASFFHGSAWAGVLADTYHYKLLYLAETLDGVLQSVLPLMEVRSWITGRRGISLPFTDRVEPLCGDQASFDRLYTLAEALATRFDWKYLELRGGRCWRPQACASVSFYSHILELQPDAKGLFARCDDSVRRAIRKAEKAGLELGFHQDLAAMREFYELVCRTRKRHGVPPQPFEFYASIQHKVLAAGQGWIVLARHQGRPVAGAVFLHSGRGAIYKFGASDEAFQNLRANNLVMWKAIEHYAKNGFETLDFGRSSLHNEGLRRFKMGWGARESMAEYMEYQFADKAFVQGRDDTQGWHTKVFNLLPSRVSRALGSFLYRHIA